MAAPFRVMTTSLREVVDLVGGSLLRGDGQQQITGFASLHEAGPLDLSFFGNPRYRKEFLGTKAGAVIVPLGLEEMPPGASLIGVENPVLAFDRVVRRFGAPEVEFCAGVHPKAEIGPDVVLDPARVRVDAFAVVEPGARIGEGSWIGANCYVGRGVVVGNGCRLYPLVSLREGTVLGNRVTIHGGCIVGADGYGYEFTEGRHRKIRQAGIVEIEDDVEIGANTTIDRARFGSTLIGEGTKIDNLVQIGHNVQIGKHCLIVAQSGISGSARIGDYVTVAAQSGIAGHIEVGDQAVLGGRTGAIANLPGGETYFGYPAKPIKEWSRRQMLAKRIPAILKRLAFLERHLPGGTASERKEESGA